MDSADYFTSGGYLVFAYDANERTGAKVIR